MPQHPVVENKVSWDISKYEISCYNTECCGRDILVILFI